MVGEVEEAGAGAGGGEVARCFVQVALCGRGVEEGRYVDCGEGGG